MKLHHLALVALRDVIRTDPSRRQAAWDELKFRHQSRQAFQQENGQHPEAPRAPVSMRLLTSVLPRWNPPDLGPIAPLGDGPLI